MKTKCTAFQIEFQAPGRRRVQVVFDGVHFDGAVLLHEPDTRLGITKNLAACFTDHLDSELDERSASDFVRHQAYGITPGCEDVNDQRDLKWNPLLRSSRILNHPVLTVNSNASKCYKRIIHSSAKRESLFVDVFLDPFANLPEEFVMDFDETCKRDTVERPTEVLAYLIDRWPHSRLTGEEFGDVHRHPLLTGVEAGVFAQFHDYAEPRIRYKRQCWAMEYLIKDQQLELLGDRSGPFTQRLRQPRLWFSSAARHLMRALRRVGLKGTRHAEATSEAIGLKLLKIGSQFKGIARRILVRFAGARPLQRSLAPRLEHPTTPPSTH